MVEFSFDEDYDQVIRGNITKAVFIMKLRSFLAMLLNISQHRIVNMEIRKGSINVSFIILPSNSSNETSVNMIVSKLQMLVEQRDIYFTIPGYNKTLTVFANSFKIITVVPTESTTAAPSVNDKNERLTTAEIIVIAIACVAVLSAVILSLVYYFTRVKPSRTGKISPKSSQLQLSERSNNDTEGKFGVLNSDHSPGLFIFLHSLVSIYGTLPFSPKGQIKKIIISLFLSIIVMFINLLLSLYFPIQKVFIYCGAFPFQMKRVFKDTDKLLILSIKFLT